MTLEDIENLDDPRLAIYRNLKDSELAAQGDRFIVEGHFVVQRVLASDFSVESVLMAERQVEIMRPFLRDGIACYVVPNPMMNKIVGFQFHTGVIAVARRKPMLTLDQVLPKDKERLTLVILPDTCGLQNMGSLVRVSAAFGADAIIVGEKSCDPFYRLPIRVSMGVCFKIPIIRTDDLQRDLLRLRDEWKLELAATVLDESAEMLQHAKRVNRLGLLFGGEGYGLQKEWLDLCQRKITIPMRWETDSLNVAVSAAVFLYHFAQ